MGLVFVDDLTSTAPAYPTKPFPAELLAAMRTAQSVRSPLDFASDSSTVSGLFSYVQYCYSNSVRTHFFIFVLVK